MRYVRKGGETLRNFADKFIHATSNSADRYVRGKNRRQSHRETILNAHYPEGITSLALTLAEYDMQSAVLRAAAKQKSENQDQFLHDAQQTYSRFLYNASPLQLIVRDAYSALSHTSETRSGITHAQIQPVPFANFKNDQITYTAAFIPQAGGNVSRLEQNYQIPPFAYRTLRKNNWLTGGVRFEQRAIQAGIDDVEFSHNVAVALQLQFPSAVHAVFIDQATVNRIVQRRTRR